MCTVPLNHDLGNARVINTCVYEFNSTCSDVLPPLEGILKSLIAATNNRPRRIIHYYDDSFRRNRTFMYLPIPLTLILNLFVIVHNGQRTYLIAGTCWTRCANTPSHNLGDYLLLFGAAVCTRVHICWALQSERMHVNSPSHHLGEALLPFGASAGTWFHLFWVTHYKTLCGICKYLTQCIMHNANAE